MKIMLNSVRFRGVEVLDGPVITQRTETDQVTTVAVKLDDLGAEDLAGFMRFHSVPSFDKLEIRTATDPESDIPGTHVEFPYSPVPEKEPPLKLIARKGPAGFIFTPKGEGPLADYLDQLFRKIPGPAEMTDALLQGLALAKRRGGKAAN
jgi:hypothetical protein